MVGSHLADYLIENTDWDIYGMCRWRSQNVLRLFNNEQLNSEYERALTEHGVADSIFFVCTVASA